MRAAPIIRWLGYVWLVATAACNSERAVNVAVGTLERDRIELAAEAPEPLTEILVTEGQHVAAGQALIRQDESLLGAQLAQAEAAQARAEARLAEVLRGPRPEKISEAEARLAGAETALLSEQRELARSRNLKRTGAGTAEQVDLSEARHAERLALRDQARAELDALRAGATREEIDQARAAVAEATAAARALRVRVGRLVLAAPQDATVDALPFELGERPAPGAPVVILLAAGAPHARVFVPEPMRANVHVGDTATVRIDGIAAPVRGHVRVISQDPAFSPYYALTERDRGRLMYLCEVELDEPSAKDLPSGIPVEVSFAKRRADADGR